MIRQWGIESGSGWNLIKQRNGAVDESRMKVIKGKNFPQINYQASALKFFSWYSEAVLPLISLILCA